MKKEVTVYKGTEIQAQLDEHELSRNGGSRAIVL